MTYLDVIPAFEMAVYAFVTLLFVITGALNLRDLQNLRQEKWTRQDTVALALRTFFFSSLLNLIFMVMIVVSILSSITFLRVGLPIQRVLPIVTLSLEISFGIFLVTGIAYGMARWKDWYDLIDTED